MRHCSARTAIVIAGTLFAVTLPLFGCGGGSGTTTPPPTDSGPRVLNVIPSMPQGQVGQPVTFNAEVSDPAATVTWSFNGSALPEHSQGCEPTVTPAVAGQYTIGVTASLGGHAGAPFTIDYTVIPGDATKPVPVITSASVPAGSLYSGDSVTFDAVATGTVSSWAWDFGTAATPMTSADAHPTVTLGAAGHYTVTVHALNGAGSSTAFPLTIDVVPAINAESWVQSWGGPNPGGGMGNGDFAYGLAYDQSGNLFVSGLFTGTCDFDPGPGVLSATAVGGGDSFLTKRDPSGNVLWARSWGGTHFEYPYRLATDSAGSVYVAGIWCKTVDFDPGPGVTSRTSESYTDVYLSKFDANGDFQWVYTIPGPFQWGGNNDFYLAADSNTGIVVGGNLVRGENQSTDAHVALLDSATGTPRWTRTWNNPFGPTRGYAHEIGLGFTPAGEVVAALGASGGPIDTDPGPGAAMIDSAACDHTALVTLGSDGSFINTQDLEFRTTAFATAGNGMRVLTGYGEHGFDFDPGPGIHELEYGVWLLALDPDGSTAWLVEGYAAPGQTEAASASSDYLAVTPSGGVLIAGYANGNLEFEGPNGDFDLVTPYGPTYWTSSYLLMIDPTGQPRWAHLLQGGWIGGTGISASGVAAMSGYFESGLTAQRDTGAESLTSNGSYDCYSLQVTPNGAF